MRLRLSVQRHRLPPTNIIWNVPDSSSAQAYTVARLLEDVNNIIPLEAEHWGLEDYTVEIGGFECLHFSPVVQSLKDDDQVCIRPLLTAEVRARTLSGRYQISEGGQHLVDGVPFGRPYLRTPNRPAVRIAPRRHPLLLEDRETGREEDHVGLITENGELSSAEEGSVALLDGDTNRELQKATLSRRHSRMVHFDQPQNDELDSDDEDDEFAPHEASDASDISEDDSEDASDDSDISSSLSTTDTSSSEESDSDSDTNSTSEAISSKDQITPPHRGSKPTRDRNTRRKESLKLRRLKDDGTLPGDATLADLRMLQIQTSEHPEQATGTRTAQRLTKTTSSKRKHDAVGTNAEDDADNKAELERRRQELIARVTNGSPMVENATSAEPSPKRLRPDIPALNRILSRQARPLAKQALEAKPTPLEQSQSTLTNPDPNLWKSTINLSAFECWNEEYTLGAPPFPFKQHWDPASKLIRENDATKRSNKKKRGNRLSQGLEVESHSAEVDHGQVPAGDGGPDADANAAIESQLLRDLTAAAGTDLPALPDDIASLPLLSPGDVRVGAIVAFKQFIINPATMNPEISGFVVAAIEEEGDSGNGTGTIALRLAERDRPRREKRFDKHGNRIYNRADNFHLEESGEEGEEAEDGLVQLQFSELLEARLMKAE